MVEIRIEYTGELRCSATHAPSGTALVTDAPVDNRGKGASFSPTDLVATALGSCIATTMAIVAERHDWSLVGMCVTVTKKMVADPVRRIGELEVVIEVPTELDEKARTTLEETAHTCPVHKSLADNVQVPMRFRWAAAV